MEITVAAKTDVGRVRKKNEDRCGYDERAGIYVVCDGMGGQAAGEIAAELAVKTILEFYGNGKRPGNLEGDLRQAITLANTAIRQLAEKEPQYHKMGSTIVAIAIEGDKAAVGNVGDARGYLLRAGEVKQITIDHSLVAEQVRRGMLKPEEAEKAPWKNVVTRALGGADDVEPDLVSLEIRPHDRFIVATDGVTKFVPDAKLKEIVAGTYDLQAACQKVVAAALDNGSDDNATAMLLSSNEAPAKKQKAKAAVILK
jgi:serine/threonine protein phosphatase PrpC